MRTIRFLLQKEFLQIFRNRAMLPVIFLMPVIQLVVLSFAATYELNRAEIHLVDLDRTRRSGQLVGALEATGSFIVIANSHDVRQGVKDLQGNRADLVLQIPAGFQEALNSGVSAPVQVMIDAVDGVKAGLIEAYARAIVQDFNQSVLSESPGVNLTLRPGGDADPEFAARSGTLRVRPLNYYNPMLDYIDYMVPGILVVLVSMIAMFLSGMNIVRERELGTIEQLNVSPVRKYQFITAKLAPFWIIGMFELLVGLAIARFGFQVPFLGSLWLLLGIAAVYLLVVLGMGLFISTVTRTQQQAMFIAWFIMVVFILMGGLFTPLESMPDWARQLARVNPIALFITIMRALMLKGAGLQEVAFSAGVLAVMASVILPAAIFRYRKVSA